MLDRLDRFSRALGWFTILLALFAKDENISSAQPVSLVGLVHDLIQYNIAGVPIIHKRTEWEFDPKVGTQRRARYEAENGRYGEIAIAKLGMGIGYQGPWGTTESD